MTLKQKVKSTQEQLQAAQEQFKAAQEELQAAQEQSQAALDALREFQKVKMVAELDEKEREIARLRAELMEVAPPSPVKQPLSEADAEAVGKIKEQAAKEDKEAYCTFECLDKHQLMDLPEGALMPMYQDLKRDHPTMLVSFTISFAEACAGVHVEKVLTWPLNSNGRTGEKAKEISKS